MKKRTHFEGEIRHPSRKVERLRVIEIRHVPTPDADVRLSRVIDILLRSAAGDTPREQESPDTRKEPPRQAPAGDTLTGSIEEDRPFEE